MIATAFCGCAGNDERIMELSEISSADDPDVSANVMKDTEEKAEEAKPEAGKIVVYVCGAVRSPDVYTLSGDARVKDAVDAAGGFTPDAGFEHLNLAGRLSDGQKIYIPTSAEIEEALKAGEGIYSAEVNITSNTPGINPLGTSESEEASEGGGMSTDGKVDINSADKSTLMTLPGIGESKADKIIAYRQANGKFSCIEDIMLVGGIKEGLFNKVKDSICVR